MPTEPLLPESAQLWAWQSRLLPFVLGVLSLLTLFACVANVLQVYEVEKHIESTHEVDINNLLPATIAGTPTASEQLLYARWRTLVALEANAVESRYHQASMLLMTRVYIVFLGFTTGMVLAMVGATFIVAKLRETEAKVEGGTANWKVAFTTASPGLVLALFGTILMLATIWARTEISVRDKSVYLGESFDTLQPTSAPVSPGEALKKLKESSESIKDKLENKEK
jgi:hypothetical protein